MCLLKKLRLFSSFAFFIISYMCNTLGIYLHKAEPQTSSTGVKSCKVLQFTGALFDVIGDAGEVKSPA